MIPSKRRLWFAVFFVSGFSGLAYEVIWTRMAFASFGIITPVLSVVLSVYMLGLSVGAWAGGHLIASWVRKSGQSALFFYGLAEGMIGAGAFVVPHLFRAANHALLSAGQMNSAHYLLLSALALAAAILPWCLCMGTTFPFMMAHLREAADADQTSFSFLYLANVLGAMSGCLLTAVVLVELMGFERALWLAAAGNFSISFVCLAISQRPKNAAQPPKTQAAAAPIVPVSLLRRPSRGIGWILFTTGFTSMAMEVVWTRAFTPVLQTQVYSFALIVFTYLGATSAGASKYRRDARQGAVWSAGLLLAALVVAANVPVLANDPRWAPPVTKLRSSIIVLAGIVPFCAILGYLTPSLIDEYAAGNPSLAGRAYGINILGCILGPLLASYLLLPALRERNALFILTAPLFALYFLQWKGLPARWRAASAGAAAVALAWSLFFTQDFEDLAARYKRNMEVRRDFAASVLAFGNKRAEKRLFVNGTDMTALAPITKFMVHLPLALHRGPSASVLIICFGMGTSYRSALSWGLDTTAIELVPSVPKLFGFYHADAAQVLRNPKGRIVVDDGRRFLGRTAAMYDLIVVDPPPPVEAAGSSLLYSTEFYRAAKLHLKTNGLLATWLPDTDPLMAQAVSRSLQESFPCVRSFQGVTVPGMQFLASMEPIPSPSVYQMAARFPPEARRDLLEWNPEADLITALSWLVSAECGLPGLAASNPRIVITDNHPFNEYFLLRSWGWLAY